MTTLEVLQKARSLVMGGWCKGHFAEITLNGNKRYCLVGALYEAEKGYPHYKTLEAMQKATGWWNLFMFNDDPRRTKEEVLAAFDRAIMDEKYGI